MRCPSSDGREKRLEAWMTAPPALVFLGPVTAHPGAAEDRYRLPVRLETHADLTAASLHRDGHPGVDPATGQQHQHGTQQEEAQLKAAPPEQRRGGRVHAPKLGGW
jgi:hypothetical protein